MTNTELQRAILQLKCITLDVDGVLTDGRITYAEGLELKSFYVQDGYGIKAVQNAGIEVAIVTGRESVATARRAQELNIQLLYQGIEDKTTVFAEICEVVKCQPEQVAHVGDDVPDLALFDLVGIGVAPADAHSTVRAQADIVTAMPGGRGAVREFCDLVVAALDGQ